MYLSVPTMIRKYTLGSRWVLNWSCLFFDVYVMLENTMTSRNQDWRYFFRFFRHREALVTDRRYQHVHQFRLYRPRSPPPCPIRRALPNHPTQEGGHHHGKRWHRGITGTTGTTGIRGRPRTQEHNTRHHQLGVWSIERHHVLYGIPQTSFWPHHGAGTRRPRTFGRGKRWGWRNNIA